MLNFLYKHQIVEIVRFVDQECKDFRYILYYILHANIWYFIFYNAHIDINYQEDLSLC